MKFNELDCLYYKFQLDANLLPERLHANQQRRWTWAVEHAHQQLGEFVKAEIIKDDKFICHSFHLIFITNDKQKLKEVKKFCHYLIESNQLLELTIKHILEKFSLEEYQKGFMKAYEYLKLEESLLINKQKNDKKPKI